MCSLAVVRLCSITLHTTLAADVLAEVVFFIRADLGSVASLGLGPLNRLQFASRIAPIPFRSLPVLRYHRHRDLLHPRRIATERRLEWLSCLRDSLRRTDSH